MTDPIYPDKEKTGLAALKPLTDAFFAEPERWVWEWLDGEAWDEVPLYDAVYLFDIVNRQVRLTPKPRRVWIGDQSYPEPLRHIENGDFCYLANIALGKVQQIRYDHDNKGHRMMLDEGFLFGAISENAAQQCLYAYRKARRVE